MSNQTNEEKRDETRVFFNTQIVLKTDVSEIQVEGSSKDLSLNGIFVNTDEDIPVNTECHLEVLLSGTKERIALQMEGEVVRKEPSGLAITFHSIDLDSYTHLKNIVSYNTGYSD